MTLRMPPWEAERIANVLLYAEMLTATEPKMKPWMKACAARIKEMVKREKERRETKRNSALKECCSTCKWLLGAHTLEPNCYKREFVIPSPDNISCCYYESNKKDKRRRTEDMG